MTHRMFLIGYAAVWFAFALWSVPPGYVHQDTAEVVMWSGLGLQAGYNKHPPFLPWLFYAIGSVVPLHQTTLAALSAINLTVALWAVMRIAERVLPPERRTLTILLFVTSSLVTWQAVKLNHNAILVSLWPLAILAFLRFRDAPTMTNGALLGLAAGAAINAKYYSALLLAAMALALLATAPRRYAQAAGSWTAAGITVLAFAPHLYWVIWIDGGQSVITGQPMPGGEPGSVVRMLSRNLTSLAPMLVAAGVIGATRREPNPSKPSQPVLSPGDGWTLGILMAVPYTITLAAIAFGGMRGSATWAMPVFTVLPVLLAGLLPTPYTGQETWLHRILVLILVVVVVAIPVTRYEPFRRGEPSSLDPRAEIADLAITTWKALSDAPLRLVAGDQEYAMTVSQRAHEIPRAWPLFTDWHYVGPANVEAHGVLAICDTSDQRCLTRMEAALAGRPATSCRATLRQVLLDLQGPPVEIEIRVVLPSRQVPEDLSGRNCGGLAGAKTERR